MKNKAIKFFGVGAGVLFVCLTLMPMTAIAVNWDCYYRPYSWVDVRHIYSDDGVCYVINIYRDGSMTVYFLRYGVKEAEMCLEPTTQPATTQPTTTQPTTTQPINGSG
jgi:hypothetical protein